MDADVVDRLTNSIDVRLLLELDVDQRAAAKVDAHLVMPCQKSIDRTPATLKISEKARKYHFFPSQSTLMPRNSST